MPTKTSLVHQALVDHPDHYAPMTNAAIGRTFQCDSALVGQVRRKLGLRSPETRGRRGKKVKLPAPTRVTKQPLTANEKESAGRPSGLPMSLTIPEGGLRVGLRDDSGNMVGTLLVNVGGCTFLAPNRKTRPTRELPWVTVEAIQELGLATVANPS